MSLIVINKDMMNVYGLQGQIGREMTAQETKTKGRERERKSEREEESNSRMTLNIKSIFCHVEKCCCCRKANTHKLTLTHAQTHTQSLILCSPPLEKNALSFPHGY